MPRVAVPVRSKEPMFVAHLANRSQDSYVDNWRRYNGAYGFQEHAEDRPEHIWEILHRTDARGDLVSRVIIELERRGKDSNGRSHVSFGRWHGVESELRQFLIEGVEQRREEDRAVGRLELTIGFYVGSWTNGSPYTVNLRTATGQLNLKSKRDRRLWEKSILPWIDCGMLSELWYDAGALGGAWDRKHWDRTRSNLDQQMNRYGLYGGTEAYPHTRDRDRSTPWPQDITWVDPKDTPIHCISRYILDRDPAGLMNITKDWGADREVHIQSSSHRRIDGTSGALTEDMARDYTARGFVVGSWMRAQDWIINLPLNREQLDHPMSQLDEPFKIIVPITQDGVERDINELR